MSLEIIYLIYMYKKDLVLNNLQWLICHKTKPNQTKPNENLLFIIYKQLYSFEYFKQLYGFK